MVNKTYPDFLCQWNENDSFENYLLHLQIKKLEKFEQSRDKCTNDGYTNLYHIAFPSIVQPVIFFKTMFAVMNIKLKVKS